LINDAVGNAITEIRARLGERIGQVQSTLDTHGQGISAVTHRVDELATDVQAIQTTMEIHQSRLDAHAHDLRRERERIDVLQHGTTVEEPSIPSRGAVESPRPPSPAQRPVASTPAQPVAARSPEPEIEAKGRAPLVFGDVTFGTGGYGIKPSPSPKAPEIHISQHEPSLSDKLADPGIDYGGKAQILRLDAGGIADGDKRHDPRDEVWRYIWQTVKDEFPRMPAQDQVQETEKR
ncbi:hypothetical protein V8E36_008358, partial [Tilletia maclaganii]